MAEQALSRQSVAASCREPVFPRHISSFGRSSEPGRAPAVSRLAVLVSPASEPAQLMMAY